MNSNDSLSDMRAQFEELLSLCDQHLENGNKAQAKLCLIESGKLVKKIFEMSCGNPDTTDFTITSHSTE